MWSVNGHFYCHSVYCIRGGIMTRRNQENWYVTVSHVVLHFSRCKLTAQHCFFSSRNGETVMGCSTRREMNPTPTLSRRVSRFALPYRPYCHGFRLVQGVSISANAIKGYAEVQANKHSETIGTMENVISDKTATLT